MAMTRPSGEQLRFASAATGEHVLDDYLEAAEKGGRTLPDLLDDLFNSSGVFNADLFQFRVNTTSRLLQYRVGVFVDPNDGWLDTTSRIFRNKGAHADATAYELLELVTYNNALYFCTTAHTSSSAIPSGSNFALVADVNTIDLTAYLQKAGGTMTGAFVGAAVSATSLALPGVISPPQITANQNDYSPTDLATSTILRLTSDASRNITGVATGASGRVLILENVGSFDIVLVNESASSTAANRLALTVDRTLAAGRSIILIYDATSSRWRDLTYNSKATAATVRTGTDDERFMTVKSAYDAFAPVALTDGATVNIDMSTGINFTLTKAINGNLANPTNMKVGQTGYIQITQDGTGSRTMSFDTYWKREGGDPPLSTAAASVDYVFYQVISSTIIIYSFVKAPS